MSEAVTSRMPHFPAAKVAVVPVSHEVVAVDAHHARSRGLHVEVGVDGQGGISAPQPVASEVGTNEVEEGLDVVHHGLERRVVGSKLLDASRQCQQLLTQLLDVVIGNGCRCE